MPQPPQPLPIVLIHGYSSEGADNSGADIYGSLPADLRRELGSQLVHEIDLSRWISLSDGIALDDVSFAMERALRSAEFSHLLDTGFHAIIHSTGALVVRNWLRLYAPRPAPIQNLVHLAGANFGSGLAHIGRGVIARWYRQIFKGTDAGVRVLDALEFGSSKTIDLHRHFLQPGYDMLGDYGVREFCAIGSQTLPMLRLVPVRYLKEDSSDNTVRTSAGNLNFNYVRISPTAEAFHLDVEDLQQEIDQRLEDKKIRPDWYQTDVTCLADERPPIPFAIVYETAHMGQEMGILKGSSNRDRVLPLLQQALEVESEEQYAAVTRAWHKVTAACQRQVARRKAKQGKRGWDLHRQYEGHSQLIFRLNDQFGDPVEDFDLTFRSGGDSRHSRLERMIEDKHINRKHRGTVLYYLRTQMYDGQDDNLQIKNRLENVAPLDFEITGFEPGSEQIAYLPVRIKLKAREVQALIQPFRTTIVDVVMLRLPHGEVFRLKKDS